MHFLDNFAKIANRNLAFAILTVLFNNNFAKYNDFSVAYATFNAALATFDVAFVFNFAKLFYKNVRFLDNFAKITNRNLAFAILTALFNNHFAKYNDFSVTCATFDADFVFNFAKIFYKNVRFLDNFAKITNRNLAFAILTALFNNHFAKYNDFSVAYATFNADFVFNFAKIFRKNVYIGSHPLKQTHLRKKMPHRIVVSTR